MGDNMKIYILDNKKVLEILLIYFNRQELLENEKVYYALDKENIIIFIKQPFYTLFVSKNFLVIENIGNNQKNYNISARIDNAIYLDTIDNIIRIGERNKENIVLINAMTCTGYGEATFKVICKQFNDKITICRRVWYQEINNDSIIKALNNDYDIDAFNYIGHFYIAQRIINNYFRQLLYIKRKEILDITLTQLYILKLLKEQKSKVELQQKRTVYKMKIKFGDIIGKWEDTKHETSRDSLDDIRLVAEMLISKSIYIYEVEKKEVLSGRQLLLNTSDIVQGCVVDDYGAEDILNALISLNTKGAIKNYQTNSRTITENTNFELGKNLKEILLTERYSVLNEKINAYSTRFELSKKAVNNSIREEAVLPILTAYEHLQGAELVVYDFIVRNCIASFLGECKLLKKKIKGNIAGRGFVVAEEYRILDPGHQILSMSIEELEDMSSLEYNDDIKKGDFINIAAIEIYESNNKKVYPYTIEKIVKLLEFKGHAYVGENRKIENQNKSIDNVTDRFNEINDLLEKELIQIDKNEFVYLTEKGMEILDQIPDIAVNRESLEYFFNNISKIKELEDYFDVVLLKVLPMIEYMINRLPANNENIDRAINYKLNLSQVKCPICKCRMKDYGTSIKCINWRACNFRINKVMNGHVLTYDEIMELSTSGVTSIINDFNFKNGKCSARLKVDKEKKVVKYEFPEI